jgi:hypothetical protein
MEDQLRMAQQDAPQRTAGDAAGQELGAARAESGAAGPEPGAARAERGPASQSAGLAGAGSSAAGPEPGAAGAERGAAGQPARSGCAQERADQANQQAQQAENQAQQAQPRPPGTDRCRANPHDRPAAASGRDAHRLAPAPSRKLGTAEAPPVRVAPRCTRGAAAVCRLTGYAAEGQLIFADAASAVGAERLQLPR